ncbi:MAG: hypothetical protein AAF790_07135 [Planctomycetota bacterium]
MPRLLACAAAAVALLAGAARSDAQLVTYYSPVVPAPVVAAPPVPVPVLPAPAPVRVVSYRPIAPTVVYRPVYQPIVAPAPVTVARPVVAAPVVTQGLAPVAYTRTRWRPLLGGTVTRVRYGYAPVTYYGY